MPALLQKQIMFALCDGNNFFVSCERVFRPDLQYKPIVVVSSNDGCIVARSNEVKALGIPMGSPVFKVQDIIKEHRVEILSSNFELYGDMSSRLMKSLETFSPFVEPYSIDEAFLGFKGSQDDFEKLGLSIKSTLFQWLGLPVSLGFAPTKTLAKIANALAKKDPSGVFVLDSDEKIEKTLSHIPIEDVWGVGRKGAKKFREQGLYTALDLRKADPKFIRKSFTIVAERLVLELRSLSCLPLEMLNEGNHSIQITRSFGKPITSLQDLREAIATYASRVSLKLRQQKKNASALLVYISTSPFQKESYFRDSYVVKLEQPSQQETVLIKAACSALERIYKPNYPYKKAGVVALDLLPESMKQFSFGFQSASSKQLISSKDHQLTKAIDQINKRFGSETIILASCGLKKEWAVRQGNKSPNYTKSWKELPVVYAK